MGCCPDDSDSVIDDTSNKVRTCTDLLWLAIFIMFWIFMLLIACFAFVYGNPLRLIHGYDSFGNTCGLDSNEGTQNFNISYIDFSKKRYLFYMDFANLQRSLQICVEKCPDRNLESLSDLEEFYKDTGSFLCRYDTNLTQFNFPHYFSLLPGDTPITPDEMISSLNGPCPVFPVFKSKSVLNRCVLEPVNEISSNFISNMYQMLNSWDFLEEISSDLYKTWKWILIFSLFSFVLSQIVVSFMYMVASFVSWIIMIGVSVAAVGSTGILWWTYLSIKCELDDTPSDQILDESLKNEEAFLWFAVIATIITVVLLLLVIVMRKRISFLTLLFQESSNCLANLPELYLLPVITFTLLISFYTFWISVIVSLATASYPSTRSIKPYSDIANTMIQLVNDSVFSRTSTASNISIAEIKTFTAVEYIDSVWINYMWFVYAVGLIWVSEFIFACQHIIVAGSVAKWYFNRDRNNSRSVIITSSGNLLAYHLGSAALGSLLITVFKVPRLIITYIRNKLNRRDEDSTCANCTFKCCYCCFHCWEKFLKYVNHNAYAIVAVQGIDFCPAAYRAWNVLANNALKLATINSVGDFILFLGKCFVTASTTCVAVFVFKHDPNLHFFAVPSFTVFIFAFFIAHSVISLYELVIDTLYLCICEDQEINGDSGLWKHSSLCGARSPNCMALPIESMPTEL